MKQLEELKKKVLQIIQRNKGLQEANTVFKLENSQLQEKNSNLEAALQKENQSQESLENEKAALKSSIEDLLSSIGSLQANKEASK